MSGKKTVLLVDDEKTLVKALKFNLEKEGFQVEEAFDGEEALEKAFNLNPDIIILDLMLPGLDGFEVCREIRKKKRSRLSCSRPKVRISTRFLVWN